jgi:signal transduction histidine kinase
VAEDRLQWRKGHNSARAGDVGLPLTVTPFGIATRMRLSIRYQLLGPLLILLLGVAGICAWTALAAAARSRQEIEERVRSVARTSAERSYPLNNDVLEGMKGLSGAEYAVRDPDGKLSANTQGLHATPTDLPPPGDWQTLGLGPPVRAGEDVYLCSGVRLPNRPPGTTLYIFYPEASWRDALWEAVYPSLAGGLVGGLVAAALAVAVARGLSRRVRALERRTRLIAAGDFSPMPLPARDDELRDLARSVNEMAERLAQLQEAARKNERLRLLGQVSGGLAHQLRNGVTGARLAVQLHARECANGVDREALEVALRQLALVEANLKRFLDLGRDGELRREPCALAALIDEVVCLLRPQCRHAHIDLRWQPPDGVTPLEGDAAQLRHLFLNVIGNAIEAAGPGGWVEVRHSRDDRGTYRVEVRDGGPGPAPDVADRLFEPFVSGKREGVGLGLAVARRVAEDHGGHIAWQRDRECTEFRIELPAAGQGASTQ